MAAGTIAATGTGSPRNCARIITSSQPDLRGHGDSQWAVGGSYALADFVYDIQHLLKQKDLTPISIVAHSMGGAISLLYAGAFPETVKKLVVIEGIIMSPAEFEKRRSTPLRERMSDWVEQLHDLSGRAPRKYKTLEEGGRAHCGRKIRSCRPIRRAT